MTVRSEELENWIGKSYNTDSYVVGTHLEINSEAVFPLKMKILFGLPTENKILRLRDLIKEGRLTREEIQHIVDKEITKLQL